MTIEFDCDSGDYSSAENLISRYLITASKGIAEIDLKKAELAEVGHMFSLHRRTHPGHSFTWSFHVPEGYEAREGIIYKSSKKAKSLKVK